MAVSFKLKPRKGEKRQVQEVQGEAVQEIGQLPSALPDSSLSGPQWFERPCSTLEKQLELLPDPPTEADYDRVPINVFAETVIARLSAGESSEGRKKARMESYESD